MLFLAPLLSTGTSYASSTDFLPACSSGGIASNTKVCGGVQKQTKNNSNVVITIIKDAINILSYIVGIASIIIIIISGFTMIVAGGDSNSTANAKKGLLAAVIGILVVALAQALVVFVLDYIK